MATHPDRLAGIPQQFSSLPHTHTVRQMKEFVLTEAELDDISLLNTLASGFFAAASGAFLFAVGLYTSAIMQGTLSEKATALLQFGGVTGLILAVACVGVGSWAWCKRRSRLTEIKRQAVAIDQMSAVSSQPQPDISIQPISDNEGSQT